MVEGRMYRAGVFALRKLQTLIYSKKTSCRFKNRGYSVRKLVFCFRNVNISKNTADPGFDTLDNNYKRTYNLYYEMGESLLSRFYWFIFR